MFIGYPKGTRGGIFYNPKEKKVIVSTHATFLEEDYMNNFKPKSKVVLEELDSVRDPPQTPIFPPLFPVDVQRGENVQNVPEGEQTQETAQDQIQETQEQEHNEEIGNPPEPQNLDPSVHVQQPMQQTRNGRLIRKPVRYALLGETYQVVLDNPDDDPTTYEEALEDVDVQEWKKAMDREMESMGSNSVWSLIEAPKGVKPIGCKWIYKRIQGIVVVFLVLYVDDILLI